METRKRNVAPNASTDKPEPPASAQTPPAAKQRTTGSEDVLTKTLGIIALVAVSLLAGSLLLAVAGRLRPHTHRRVHCSAAVSPSYACPLTPAQRDALSEGGDCGLPPACDAPYAAHDTWAHVRMVDRVPSVQVVNFTRMRGNAPKRTLLIGPSGPCALPVKNITVLSTDPYVIVIDGFITDDEADTVKAEGLPSVGPSGQFHADETAKKAHDASYRTSSTAYFAKSQNSIISCIEKRASDFSGYPVENMESLQFLRYELNQEYKEHWDFFMPGYPAWDEEIARNGQRSVTFFVYLNNLPDAESGGETGFVKLNLKVKPKRGRAVFWYDTLASGKVDERTLHAGLPVLKGTKYAMNIWIRDRPSYGSPAAGTVHDMYWYLTTGVKRLLKGAW